MMVDREKVINDLVETRELIAATKNMFEIGFPNIVSHIYVKALSTIDGAIALLETQTQKQPNCNTAYHDAAGCLGFCNGEDDEPIDICKACEKYTGNREGGETDD